MVLERLDLVEIAALAHLEAVVAVELEERSDDWVLAAHTLEAGVGVRGLQDGAVPPIGVVERLLALPGVDGGIIAGHEAVALDNPDELLARVVEVQLELVGRGGDRLTAGELQALNQVLVGDLGELAALISVKVDVVNIERRGDQASGGHTVADGVDSGGRVGSGVPAEVADVLELEVDADLVVLERNQWQRKARVAAEPELEGNVESVLRRAVADLCERVGLTRGAVRIARLTTLLDDVDQLGYIANHLRITGLLTGLLGELIPNVEPVTVVLVNALAADLELDIVDEVVANPVEPAELGTSTVSRGEGNLGEGGLEVDAAN